VMPGSNVVKDDWQSIRLRLKKSADACSGTQEHL